MGSNFEKFIFATDLHGDMADPDAVVKLFSFMEVWKPEVVIFGGDLVDLRPLRKGASSEEKSESMRADIGAGNVFIDRFFRFGKVRVFHLGNHDARLDESAHSNDGALADLADAGVRDRQHRMGKLKAITLPYDKRSGIYQRGHLRTLHGFACGAFAARQTAAVYGASIFGHVHASEAFSIPGLERRVARSSGCLCRLDMPYSARTPSSLRQCNGWVFGVINKKTGIYHCWSAENTDGLWVVPSDIVEL